MKWRDWLHRLWGDPALRFDLELVCAVAAIVALLVGPTLS